MLLTALLFLAAGSAPAVSPSPLEAACGAADAQLLVLGTYHICLLYTSPSPRD